jgi:Domain of unknown function (DUF4402)
MIYSKLHFEKVFLVLITLIISSGKLIAQIEDPPVPIEITAVISSVTFGTFYDPGNDGGSIYINPQTGTRSPSGLATIGSTYSRAEYNITGGNAGTVVVFTFSESIVLTREGGGGTIDMDIEIYPTPFIVIEDPSVTTKLYIGGTLNMTTGVPAGTYNSTEFQITLNQQ